MPPTPCWWMLALTQLIPPSRLLQTTNSQLCVHLATACSPPLPCSPLQVMQAELRWPHLIPACLAPMGCLHATAPPWRVSQFLACAGNYSESAFRALDTIIAKAAQYGIRLILTFADNWSLADSKMNVRTLNACSLFGCTLCTPLALCHPC